jgi:hypothetical protein
MPSRQVGVEDCERCGAHPKHQRWHERRCDECDDIFLVKTDRSKRKFCGRPCQLDKYSRTRSKT